MHGIDDVYDRRSSFVINDDAQMEQVVFSASKTQSITSLGQRPVTPIAVREHETAKLSEVLLFMHAAPYSVSTELDTWVAVPKLGVQSDRTLFTDVTTPLGKLGEAVLSFSCYPRTIGQRCVDWFTLRQFRVTETNAGIILAQDASFRESLDLSSTSVQERTMSDWFTLFMNGWFSNKVSTEKMMQGSVNEGPVMENLRKIPLIVAVFEVGMVTLKEHPHLPCSPHGVAIIKAGSGRDESV